MLRQVFLAIAFAATGFAATPTAAQTTTTQAPTARTPIEQRANDVVTAINGEADPAQLFTPGFLKAVPPAQLAAVSASFTAQLGRAVAVASLTPRDGTRAAIVVRFERGIAKGVIAIDPAQGNLINELLFTQLDPVAPEGDSPAKIAADIAALPGSVNAWFAPLDGGAPLVSINPDKPLALGSAFKLYVLAALAEDVKAGRRRWSDVVALTEKSYPSGQLQNWPKGAPVTLHTLASLMISISDNTATDQLIAVLGKERILRLMADSRHSDPGANDPFLTTRQLFELKASNPETLANWRGGEPEIQAAIAMAIADNRPDLDRITAAFANGPKALDIEWFAAPSDLSKLFAHMRRTADPEAFAILAINPQVSGTARDQWSYAGFKGGSEPGVINLSWLLTDKAGRDWVLTLCWNNPDAVVDDGKFLALAQRILLLPR